MSISVNSTGHLLYKTNPNLCYFKLSYVFWEHNYSVGKGTTVPIFLSSNLFPLRVDVKYGLSLVPGPLGSKFRG